MKHVTYLSVFFLLCGCIMEDKFDTTTKSSEIRESLIPLDSYYWFNGKKEPLQKMTEYTFVITEEEATENLNDIVTRSGISPQSIGYKRYSVPKKAFRLSNESRTVWSKIPTRILAENQRDIIYSAPYYKTAEGFEVGLTNYFMIKLKKAADLDELKQFAEEHSAIVLYGDEISLWYTLTCTSASEMNALELANKAYESGCFASTDVEFVDDIQFASSPSYNDANYSYQWNLTGKYGINLGSTHSITTGSDDITVAVIDNGFIHDHPDMPIDAELSWDANSQTSPARQYYYNNNTVNNHGIGVAGVIGAVPNNDKGVVGIAPGVNLMAISAHIEMHDSTDMTALNALKEAIDYASDNAADVINNSWTSIIKHESLDDAISNALNEGRDGKGCIVVFSSGNDSLNISKMPYRDNAGVICVGATIADGFRWLKSNYSEHLDIVAPGSYIPTLGETPEYRYPDGTSFAAPHVSAVAGLILSVNPALTRQQVSDIIEITARKLPDYTFSDTEGRNNGKWNQEVGYGLLNAMDAVSYAKGYYNLASFEYSGQSISLTLTANEDIAVIWDWETEDITEIDVTSTTTRTIEHTYTTSGTRRIYIAEKIDFDTDTLSYNSTALVKFDLTTGNYASNFEFKPHNTALEYIRIIGGSNFVSQTVSIKELPALKDLYLVHMPNAIVTIAHCPSLLRFGSSKYIWEASSSIFPIPITPISPGFEKPLDPDVVGDGPVEKIEWPYVPEPIVSYGMLSITDCNNLKEVSLENVNIGSFDFSDFPYLEYVYVSSQSHRIVGGGSNVLSPSCNGEFLASTVSTLPQRTINRKGKIAVRGVDSTNGLFKKVWISSQNQSLIEETCSDKNWEVVWDSGITNTGM